MSVMPVDVLANKRSEIEMIDYLPISSFLGGVASRSESVDSTQSTSVSPCKNTASAQHNQKLKKAVPNSHGSSIPLPSMLIGSKIKSSNQGQTTAFFTDFGWLNKSLHLTTMVAAAPMASGEFRR